MRIVKCIIIAAVTALAVLAAVVLLWLHGAFIPAYAQWEEKTFYADADNDEEDESVRLSARRLSIKDEDHSFKTEYGLKIQDVYVRDIDRDGENEVIILVWKRGSYGDHKPFWVEEDDRDFSQHIFIYKYADERLNGVWMSSDIGRPVRYMRMDEEDHIHLYEKDGKETVWMWGSWGLVLIE